MCYVGKYKVVCGWVPILSAANLHLCKGEMRASLWCSRQKTILLHLHAALLLDGFCEEQAEEHAA